MSDSVIERQAETIRFLQRELSEQRRVETALRKRIAYLLTVICELYDEVKKYVNIDPFLMEYLIMEKEAYKDYFEEKKHIDSREALKKVAYRFIPIIYQYLTENIDKIVLKYNEFYEWLRKNHPTIYKLYSMETITRSIRFLTEEGFLKTVRRGEFIFTSKMIEYLKNKSRR